MTALPLVVGWRLVNIVKSQPIDDHHGTTKDQLVLPNHVEFVLGSWQNFEIPKDSSDIWRPRPKSFGGPVVVVVPWRWEATGYSYRITCLKCTCEDPNGSPDIWRPRPKSLGGAVVVVVPWRWEATGYNAFSVFNVSMWTVFSLRDKPLQLAFRVYCFLFGRSCR